MFYFLNWKVIEKSGEGRRRQEKHWSGSGKITLMISASKGDDGLRLSAQIPSEPLKPVLLLPTVLPAFGSQRMYICTYWPVGAWATVLVILILIQK